MTTAALRPKVYPANARDQSLLLRRNREFAGKSFCRLIQNRKHSFGGFFPVAQTMIRVNEFFKVSMICAGHLRSYFFAGSARAACSPEAHWRADSSHWRLSPFAGDGEGFPASRRAQASTTTASAALWSASRRIRRRSNTRPSARSRNNQSAAIPPGRKAARKFRERHVTTARRQSSEDRTRKPPSGKCENARA